MFGCNADGIRTEKTYWYSNGTSTDHAYVLDGTKIVKETVTRTNGTDVLYYYYDESRNVIGFEYNGTPYHYQKNIQGDVLRIVDVSGIVATEYTYDACGKVLSVTGSLSSTVGNVNPFRYRGYYYDNETGFYYVSSRYYDPEVGRFINADGYVSTGQGILGNNMFAYCGNNPVNRIDPTGEAWYHWAIGAVIVVVCAGATVVTCGGFATAVGTVIAVGSGFAAATTTTTVVASTFIGAATVCGAAVFDAATTSDSIDEFFDKGNWGTVVATVGGAVLGGYSGRKMAQAASPKESSGMCFAAGTPVLAACGYIAIEEINVGDMVWAENPEKGEKELKKVVQTFVNETTELIHVYVNGKEIVTTPEHPFYTPTKGWTNAIHLRAGDMLVMQNGKYVVIEKIQHEILESPITVYNFEVEGFHTYYVGANAVLVHNTCGGNTSSKASLPKNGTKVNSSVALDMADNFLGGGYSEMSSGRFVSADGLRQLRMGDADLLGLHGGDPYINFDILYPNYKSVHIYIFDD